MGNLSSLTEGIFSAQGADAWSRVTDDSTAVVGKLDPDKAGEFRKRVDEHVAKEKAQMEEMTKEYEAAIADMKKKSALNTKERELRLLEDEGAELWAPHAGSEIKNEGLKKTVEEIMQEIETSTGRKIESRPAVKCVQKGGYQQPAPEPAPAPAPAQSSTQMSRQPSQSGSQNSGIMVGESDIDMGGTAAGLLDQMGTGLSSHSTPANNFPTPQAHLSTAQSSAATPQTGNVGSPAVAQPAPAAQQPQASTGGDVTMAGMEPDSKEQQTTAPDQGTGSGDWVVVPKDGTPSAADAAAGTVAASGSSGNTPKPTTSAAPTNKAPSAAGTPGLAGDGAFDQNDFSSLGDLDTAGDALAGFDAPGLDGSAGELGEGLDLQMDMEDSAFGDAFHGVDTSGTPRQDM